MPVSRSEEKSLADSASFIANEIRSFVSQSPWNHMPTPDKDIIFAEPLVQFADGDDPIFSEYKEIIDETHLTPREALAQSYEKNPADMPAHLSVISWILPITERTRKSNRMQQHTPSELWIYTRWHGEKFNVAVREHVVNHLREMGCLATAPMLTPSFKMMTGDKGLFSNWSERHIAYAAGLGTFGLSDGFITEKGIAHRCGSVVTDLELPASPRTAAEPYANCLFYAGEKCGKCIVRCPAGAITEKGHDKVKCLDYARTELNYLREKYNARHIGCGLCQTKVPCEAVNPTRNLKK